MTATSAISRAAAAVVEDVVDPEMPMLTLADLGVIRSVSGGEGQAVEVTITPTYSGCPAIDAMRADIATALRDAGYGPVTVRTVLSPAWSSDWITPTGRAKLASAGIAPPAPVEAGTPSPVRFLTAPPAVSCPRCGEPATEELSRFGPTPCAALRRCTACREPFEHVKAI